MNKWEKSRSKYNKLVELLTGMDDNVVEKDDAFKVAIILLYAAKYGQRLGMMYLDLPYGNVFINDVVYRLKENRIFVDGKIASDWSGEDGGLTFWLCVTVGLGFIEAV